MFASFGFVYYHFAQSEINVIVHCYLWFLLLELTTGKAKGWSFVAVTKPIPHVVFVRGLLICKVGVGFGVLTSAFRNVIDVSWAVLHFQTYPPL